MKIDEITPEYIMLVGLPGSGKSTYIEHFVDENPEKEYVVLGTDNIISSYADDEGLTYDQAMDKLGMKQPQKLFKIHIKQALNKRQNIIIDRTNLSRKARHNLLANVPKEYKKIAIVFNVDMKELKRRISQREKEIGKTIPQEVFTNMVARYEAPNSSEFDEIKQV